MNPWGCLGKEHSREKGKQAQRQWGGSWEDAWGWHWVCFQRSRDLGSWGCPAGHGCMSGCLQESIHALTLGKGWDWGDHGSASRPSAMAFGGKCEPGFYSHAFYTSSSFMFLIRIGSWYPYSCMPVPRMALHGGRLVHSSFSVSRNSAFPIINIQ